MRTSVVAIAAALTTLVAIFVVRHVRRSRAPHLAPPVPAAVAIKAFRYVDYPSCTWTELAEPRNHLPRHSSVARCERYEWFLHFVRHFRHDPHMISIPPPPPPPPRLQYALPEGINIRQRNGDPSCWMNIPFQPLVLSLRFEGDKVIVDGSGDYEGRYQPLQQVLQFTCQRYPATLK